MGTGREDDTTDHSRSEVPATTTASSDPSRERPPPSAIETVGALVRAGSEPALLDAVCRAVTDLGGLSSAWGSLSGARGPQSGTSVAILGAPAAEKEVRVFPLHVDGERVGALGVRARDVIEPRTERALAALAEDVSARVATLRALSSAEDPIRDLAIRRMTEAEEEKARIARDLHDDLAQLVTRLKLDLHWIKGRVPSEDDDPRFGRVQELLGEALRTADDVLAAVGRAARELRPPSLGALSLGEALRVEANRLTEHTSTRADVSVEPSLHDVPHDVAVAVYRIATEALTNVLRHAAAAHVSVRAAVGGDAVSLRVEDDGKGLDPSPSVPPGLGIAVMRERARMVGGTLHVGPRSPHGTTVLASIPLVAGPRR